MAIVLRGENKYLVRVYQGRHPLTGKRLEVNETVHGSYEDAVRREMLLKSKAASGEFVKSPRMTLNRLADLYLKTTKGRRERASQTQAKMFLDYYVLPYIGNCQLVNMKPSIIEKHFNFLLEPKDDEDGGTDFKDENYGLGLAIPTVRTVKTWLSSVFNFAVDEKLITENPVKKARLPPLPPTAISPLTFREAWAFISVKDQFWYGNALAFNLHTGLRPEELIALIWDDIDFDAGTLRIERACKWVNAIFTGFGLVKNQRSNRVIELAPEHIEFLREHQEKQTRQIEERMKANGWCGEPEIEKWIKMARARQRHLYKNTNLVFPTRRGCAPNMDTPRQTFKRMLHRAGLTGERLKVRWYDLRHTHATYLLTLGIPAHEIAARMGHTVEILNNRYAHVLLGRQRLSSSFIARLLPFNSVNLPSQTELQTHIREFVNNTGTTYEEWLVKMLGT